MCSAIVYCMIAIIIFLMFVKPASPTDSRTMQDNRE